MPGKKASKAVSKKQRQAAAIAEHAPDKLYKRNEGLLEMSARDRRGMAKTKEKGLPRKKRAR
jgi:hypothetical protein